MIICQNYPTKYSNKKLKSILEYLKNGKYPEGIKEMRRKKNEIIAKNELKKIKKESNYWIRRCKEAFQKFSKKDIKHKLFEYELNGKSISP